MKNASLLIALCLLFSLSVVAQAPTAADNNTKRITITTKKVDDNGKTVTETWIAEGNEPARILEEMAVNPEIMQKVVIEDASKAEGERLFLIRTAGDNEVIEGSLNENASPDDVREVIIIREDGDNPEKDEYRKISRWQQNGDHPKAFACVTVGGGQKSNCAALGVWANADGESGGAKINGLIDQGGAQEAGLLEGDIITRIDEYVVTDFPTLHDALSHFKPGDRVLVRYERDGKSLKARALLKDWAELPGHEYRSREDCGKPGPSGENSTGDNPSDNPSGTPNIQQLKLEDAQVYPNPTEGLFAFSFTAEPGPLSVTVTDVSGNVIYNELNDNPTGTYKKDIDLKDLPQGNYVICVKQGEKIFTQQISKQ